MFQEKKSSLYNHFKRINLELLYVNAWEGGYTLVMAYEQFGKLCSCSMIILNTIDHLSVFNEEQPLAIFNLTNRFKMFKLCVKLMPPYVDNDMAKLQDTIKQLKLELKVFRNQQKRNKKKHLAPPPVYIDERPPDL